MSSICTKSILNLTTMGPKSNSDHPTTMDPKSNSQHSQSHIVIDLTSTTNLANMYYSHGKSNSRHDMSNSRHDMSNSNWSNSRHDMSNSNCSSGRSNVKFSCSELD